MALEVDRETYDRRIETFNAIADALSELEGVDDAMVDDSHPRTGESAKIAVEVEHDDPIMGLDRTAWPLNANLHSLSPRIRATLDAKAGDWSITSKPESLGGGRYDQSFYYVDVWP